MSKLYTLTFDGDDAPVWRGDFAEFVAVNADLLDHAQIADASRLEPGETIVLRGGAGPLATLQAHAAPEPAKALGARGGRAGRGSAKARTSEQARAAARARWSVPLADECSEADAQAEADRVGSVGPEWRAAGYRSKLSAARVLIGAGLSSDVAERAARILAAR